MERPLAALSVPAEALAKDVAGRDVALVGNARSLTTANKGAAIDAAGLVVRINRAPMPATRTHGSRTDWLALATSIGADDLARIHTARILWMSPKRKRLPFAVATAQGFYLYPRTEHDRLRRLLNAPPTTGLMAIDLILSLGPATLSLYGFDFFASQSLTGSRTAEQVPHDFAAEKAWVLARMAADPRLRFC
jgi:hypothetical protein